MAKLREPKRGEKATLIRQLIADHPEKGNVELVAVFNEKAKAAGIDMKTREDGQEIATIRSALKKAGTGGGSSKVKQPAKREARATAPKTAAAPGQEPTATELMQVREMAESRGGLAALIEMVTEVEKMAEQVGGLDRLRACCEFWAKVEVGG